VLAVGETDVFSWDRAARPYALVFEDRGYRRALHGGLLEKGLREGRRVRRRLSAEEGAPLVESARRAAEAALCALAASGGGAEAEAASGRLRAIAAMDAAALRGDAETARRVIGRVGMLPPDQYLAVVLRATEGCSWNACTFCSLYAGVPFRARDPRELAAQAAAVKQYLGPALGLRRSVFLGDANALCLSQERLLPLLQSVAEAFPVAPSGLSAGERRLFLRQAPGRVEGVFAFVDAWTGVRKSVDDWRDCARLGLRRVYVGLESGDPGLLSFLGKPGAPEEAVTLVRALHGAGLAAGVIVLLGAGGERFFEAHARATARTLEAMALGERDIVYFSELVASEGLPYARHAVGEGIPPLSPERLRAQREAILAGLGPVSRGGRPRVSRYDIREFVY
jgi:hypothetical protein